jgi:hypothetical protein
MSLLQVDGFWILNVFGFLDLVDRVFLLYLETF